MESICIHVYITDRREKLDYLFLSIQAVSLRSISFSKFNTEQKQYLDDHRIYCPNRDICKNEMRCHKWSLQDKVETGMILDKLGHTTTCFFCKKNCKRIIF
jgi:hypothetical protein